MRLYKPFLRIKDIQRFQAKFRFWPPPDASPPIAIEPWGKNLFVYNARKNVELRGDPRAPTWEHTRPDWLIEQQKLGLLLPGEDPNDFIFSTNQRDLPEEEFNNSEHHQETVLAVTDFRKRPLTFLSQEEFLALIDNMPLIMKMMEDVEKDCKALNQEKEKENEIVRVQHVEHNVDTARVHRRGRWMKPRHDKGGRGARSGRIRMKRRI